VNSARYLAKQRAGLPSVCRLCGNEKEGNLALHAADPGAALPKLDPRIRGNDHKKKADFKSASSKFLGLNRFLRHPV
jgi:hypothetical protein